MEPRILKEQILKTLQEQGEVIMTDAKAEKLAELITHDLYISEII